MNKKKKNKKNPPESVKLSRMEVIEMENVELKINAGKAHLNSLMQIKEELGERITKKYGIDEMRRYMFNTQTGEGRRMKSENKDAK